MVTLDCACKDCFSGAWLSNKNRTYIVYQITYLLSFSPWLMLYPALMGLLGEYESLKLSVLGVLNLGRLEEEELRAGKVATTVCGWEPWDDGTANARRLRVTSSVSRLQLMRGRDGKRR